MKFIDIHTHILYGIDDGAKTEAESKEMLTLARADGTDTFIFTPHCTSEEFDTEKVRAVAASLCDTPLVGCEVLYRGAGTAEMLKSGRIPTLAGSDCVLVEFGFGVDIATLLKAVHEITSLGLTPIIAHPERYRLITAKDVGALIDAGALIQLNADSVMGKNGFSVKLKSAAILKAEFAHFIASDCHDTKGRTPVLSRCFDTVSKKYGAEYAEELFYGNANYFILNNRGN